LILKVQYFPLSDGKLSRISSRQPQLRWWSCCSPKMKFGRSDHHFIRQNWALLLLYSHSHYYLCSRNYA
jgi:hypothetical protein